MTEQGPDGQPIVDYDKMRRGMAKRKLAREKRPPKKRRIGWIPFVPGYHPCLGGNSGRDWGALERAGVARSPSGRSWRPHAKAQSGSREAFRERLLAHDPSTTHAPVSFGPACGLTGGGVEASGP